MSASVLRMLLRPASGDVRVIALPIVAFAIVTALVLTVVGGAQTFWTWSDPDAGLYQALAAIALVLLVMPLATLGGAAARLSARRRDDRLATLRLLGVTSAGVAAVAIVEAVLLAAFGALAGVAGYLALTPAVGLIPFRGAPLGWTGVLLPAPQVALVVAGVVLLAAVSALAALRRVFISPLGVRLRSDAPRVRGIRAIVGVLVIGGAVLAIRLFPGTADLVITITVVAALFAAGLAVLNLVGPWALRVQAGRGLRRAETAERMLTARTVLESPQAAGVRSAASRWPASWRCSPARLWP